MIEEFEEEYREIIQKEKKGKEVSEEIREYSLKVLKKIINNWEKGDISSREKLGEEAGEIPIKLFGMNDLKVKKELDEILSQLYDIESSKAMKNIDRLSLIKKIYEDLKNL